MSNAMRLGKRSLAGVAAGALALGMLSIAGATSSSAAPSIKPKATVAGVVSPVRPGTKGTIPDAYLNFKASSVPAIGIDDTLVMVLSTAPTANARVFIDDSTGTTIDDSVSLNDNNQDVGGVGRGLIGSVTADDSFIRIAADTAGSYAGVIGDGNDTVTFSFATTGVPTSMTLTPATQTVLVGGTGKLTATLKDASGNTTQPSSVDSITLSDNSDDTISSTSATTTALSSLSASDLARGTVEFYLRTINNPAGTTTVTASPAGTLAASGVTAQTATVTKSGTVSNSAIVNALVTAPTLQAAVSPTAVTVSPTRSLQVPSNTTSVTIAIDDTTGNPAGTQLRFGAVLSVAGTINGEVVTAYDDTVLVDVTTDSSRKATLTFAVGGNGTLNNSILEVTQVNVAGNAVASGGQVTVTQKNPAVQASSISVSPDDSVVAKLGDTTAVTVTVDDSFGTPQAGWVVTAYRAATASGTVIGTGTTNASGEATINVTNASGAVTGTVERYSFLATPPVGSPVAKDNPLQITYTTSGEITSLTVNGLGGTVLDPTSVLNTTTTITTAPLVTVPFGGVATTISTSSFTVATGLTAAAGNGGQTAAFGFVPSTRTSITGTVPVGSTGIFVSDSLSTLWSAGKTSVTVGPDDTIYVFGTKVGTHNITFTAGGKSVTIPVKVQTSASAAYNMDLTPASQSVAAGAIGTATLTVTDVFGNPVQTTDDSGEVTIAASGDVLLAGFLTSNDFKTGASGTATITFIAGNAAGSGTLAATPTTGQKAAAWNTGYTKPVGAPDPKTSAAATVTVTAAPVERTIFIEGERTTVKGAAGIAVDGLTTGFADGDKVKPFVRFPAGSYTEGTARPAVEGDEFYWERKTGKKTYVYFTAENDETIKSNRIIIPAK